VLVHFNSVGDWPMDPWCGAPASRSIRPQDRAGRRREVRHRDNHFEVGLTVRTEDQFALVSKGILGTCTSSISRAKGRAGGGGRPPLRGIHRST